MAPVPSSFAPLSFFFPSPALLIAVGAVLGPQFLLVVQVLVNLSQMLGLKERLQVQE